MIYLFIPEEYGYYVFKSHVSENNPTNPYVIVIDFNRSAIVYDDRSENLNFEAGTYLKAGRTYYVLFHTSSQYFEPFMVSIELDRLDIS